MAVLVKLRRGGVGLDEQQVRAVRHDPTVTGGKRSFAARTDLKSLTTRVDVELLATTVCPPFVYPSFRAIYLSVQIE